VNRKKGNKITRKIGVITVGRSDFGLYESVLKELHSSPSFELSLLATGAHFAPEFGITVSEIEKKGFAYERGLEMLLASDSPQGVGKAIGLGIISFAQKFAEDRPDLLLALGDRIEMLCGPVAAMSYNIPVAHIHGGAVTEGAIDDLVRHAITKMSHIHFVSCQQYADRVMQMGEEPWRVFNVGAPGLDRIQTRKKVSKAQILAKIDLDMEKDTLLVTYHPVTLEPQDVSIQVEALLTALESTDFQVVMTYPNVDVGSTIIIDRLSRFSEKHNDRVRLLKNAGTELYLALMDNVKAMVGNSSSGISEAPSFQLPVVNIGTRQAGKIRAPNVIDVGYSVEEILSGIQVATSSQFKEGLRGTKSPYGDGHAGEKIVEVLRTIEINDRLIRKKFVDLKK
jgi:GDP/UDP-N,N'-diacetylbacillosamine 2-epimerase (hydrolysing)